MAVTFIKRGGSFLRNGGAFVINNEDCCCGTCPTSGCSTSIDVTISNLTDGYDRAEPGTVWNLVPWSLFNGTWTFDISDSCNGLSPLGGLLTHHIDEVDVLAYAATLGIPGEIGGVQTGVVYTFMHIVVDLRCVGGLWRLVLGIGFTTVCWLTYISDQVTSATDYPSVTWTFSDPGVPAGGGCGSGSSTAPVVATQVYQV